ncbi:hypothetical protein Q9299_09570 [Gemmobacter fulvus]|uniref:hypothetical protein n=1 Tax=Gemmobacter fulvus TaxID=2840474 RepID=UPI002796D4AC|nr:hypothetical protein [Gemmobacter fulvus]MDQ1848533.1 hypothetical protein [Gemmobacter fulvus]
MITRAHLDQISCRLTDAEHLMAALQIIAYELSAIQLPNKHDGTTRSATIGVIDALEDKFKQITDEFEALFPLVAEAK